MKNQKNYLILGLSLLMTALLPSDTYSQCPCPEEYDIYANYTPDPCEPAQYHTETVVTYTVQLYSAHYPIPLPDSKDFYAVQTTNGMWKGVYGFYGSYTAAKEALQEIKYYHPSYCNAFVTVVPSMVQIVSFKGTVYE